MSQDFHAQMRRAAEAAVAEIAPGQVVGLGSGLTASLFIELIGERVRSGLAIRGIPTSTVSAALAARVGIPLVDFASVDSIDVAVDGADQVDGELRLIKGGGGALLHEKIVASAAERVVIVVDSSKESRTFGSFPLPIEVFPFGWQVVLRKLGARGGRPLLRYPDGRKEGAPFCTDEGNYIIDWHSAPLDDPERLAAELDAIAGVAGHGLFLNLADRVIVGTESGVRVRDRRGARTG